MFSMLDVNDIGAINEGDFLGACELYFWLLFLMFDLVLF